jgi:hypothetical protein
MYCKRNLKRIEKGLDPVELEDTECFVFAEWLRKNDYIFTHIANERKTHIAVGKKLKAMGLCSGFPDYLVIVPIGEKKHIVCIEMKRSVKSFSTVSEKQKKWVDELQKCEECEAVVAYGANEAISFIESLKYSCK